MHTMGGRSSVWCACLCVSVLLSLPTDSLRVATSKGVLEGGNFSTPSGRHVLSFLGVPYARPPVGNLRFQEPQVGETWRGVRLAKDYGPPCIQLNLFGPTAGEIIGEEDCLYLNIFTPYISTPRLLPVLVFIHGGAFTFGESRGYDPDNLVDRYDIVVVTMNYRLGPFGFLSTEDDVVPGNNGLKDQVLALKWVHDNIAFFGGDPRRVTLAGNSAGGASVHYHFLSPMSRGLFSGGISSSGSALMPWALTEQPLAKARRLAVAVGCPTVTTNCMVKCLRQRKSWEIMSQMQPLFMPWMFNPVTPFGPVIEKTTRNPFLSEHPYHLLSQGKVFHAPFLLSINTEEGLYPTGTFIDREDLLQYVEEHWEETAPHLLDFNYTVQPDKIASVSNAIKKRYLGNKTISLKTIDKVTQMMGDRYFKSDMNLAIQLHAPVTTAPMYFYIFGYRGNNSLSDFITKTKSNFGVSHFDDMFYTLAPRFGGVRVESPEDLAMTRYMSHIWASFVQTGHPGVPWSPVDSTPGLLSYMLISGPGEIQPFVAEDLGNYEFWKSLDLDENKPVDYYSVNCVCA